MSHVHEKIDFCSDVFIIYETKVLLRKHEKYGIWLGVGGHVELDEDPARAALREVKEEVGLDVKLYGTVDHFMPSATAKELIPPMFMNRHRINEFHEHVSLVFFATATTDVLVISEEEKAECKWFSKEELDEGSYEIMQGIKFYAKEALRRLG